MKVWDLKQQLAELRQANGALALRNAQLAAEVNDLKTGYAAIEARARYELGMIRKDEVFFQVIEDMGSTRGSARPTKEVAP